MRTLLTRFVLPTLIVLAPSLAVESAAQDPPPPPQPPLHTAVSTDYSFPTGAGLLFFYVRPDKRSEFEAVASRIAQVLESSEDPIRRQQAAHWRMYNSVEAVREQAIYVFFFDPALPDADYDPVRILGQGLPAEAQALYLRLADSVVRVERMGLLRIR